MRSRRGLVALCATTLAATVLASLADAHAARRPIDVTGGEGAISQASVGARESVLVPARLSRATVTWTGGPTTASTGETLVVYVSTALPLEAGTPQTWADYFAGLLHGPELTGLTAYVATLREVQEICGGEDVLGCYSSGQLVTTGESLGWVATGEIATHEYGHHVAMNRDNAPWKAVDWGTKRWASVSNICARAANESVFPGDEADRYRLNPGEGFVEAYRVANEAKRGASSFTWQIVDASFYPDAAALLAVEQDVAQPWKAPPATTIRGRFLPKGTRVWSRIVPTPLDGQLDLRLVLPETRPYGLSLLAANGKTVLAKGLWSSAKQKSVSFTVCGQRSVLVRVTRSGTAGPFRLTIAKP